MLQQKSRNKINPITKKRLPKLLSTSAFTLIELLIAMFIIGLITTVSVANYRAGEKQKRVAIAADTLVNSLHSAQNFVLTGKNTGNTNPGCGTASYYYIQLNYNSTSYNLNAVDKCGTTNVVQKYTLPDNTKIQPNSLQVDGTAVTSSLRVSFYPPYTSIKVSKDGSTDNTFTQTLIVVQSTDGQAAKTIEVDGISGRIGEYWSSPVSNTVPTVPLNFVAVNNPGGSVKNLVWSPPSSDGGSPITNYKVYRSTTSGNETLAVTLGNVTQYVDNTPGPAPFYYKISAVNAIGEGPQTAEVAANVGSIPDSTPPTTPTGLTATATLSTQINLSWTASTDNVGVTGYWVVRNGTRIISTVSTNYSDTGLTPSTTYSYTVLAYDYAGNESTQSSAASATTQAPPSDQTPPTTPTGLTATGVSTTQINLSWTASTDNVGVTGYKIYQTGVQIATSASTTYSNTGLSPSTTYLYKVQAYDAAGNNSAQSTQVSGTTQTPPDTTAPSTPTSLTATAISSSQINLSWTASTDNVAVTGYKIYRGGAQVATSASNSYADSGLSAGTTYSYTVQAYDAAGNNSAQSSSASATTPDTTAPSTPTGLTATAISSSQINLSWTASTDNVAVTGYKIFRAGTQIATSATNSYSNTALTSSTTYSYTVSAYDAAANNSAQSSTASATTQSSPPLALTQISAFAFHTCGLTGGSVYCWGFNDKGQLGNGNLTDQLRPVRVLKGAATGADTDGTYLINIKQVSAGRNHTCALSNAGFTYCWGDNFYGSSGNTSAGQYSTPIKVMKGAASAADSSDGTNLTNIKQISAGDAVTCAISNTSGTTYCWGYEGTGELGNGVAGFNQSNIPVKVLKGAAVIADTDGTYLINTNQISVGGTHVCAISNAAGTTYCWGDAAYGELGNASTVGPKSTPVLVVKGAATGADVGGSGAKFLVNIKQIVASSSTGFDEHTCAISTANNTYCWGSNTNGELGNGGTTNQSSPVKVLKGVATGVDTDGTNLINIKQISAGENDNCAISNTSGTTYCWGYGAYGELGNGSTANQLTPVKVVKGVATGADTDGTYLINNQQIVTGEHSCALSNTANSTYCWGHDIHGSLGDGGTSDRSTPVKVVGP